MNSKQRAKKFYGTKNQQKRLGGISARGVRLLVDIRMYEREHSGIGPRPLEVLPPGRANSMEWWTTLALLVDRGLVTMDGRRRLHTAGEARQITPAWVRGVG